MSTLSAVPLPHLICRCGSQLCAFPLEHVVESMRALPVSAVAAMPSYVLGVAIVRGHATPVVALADLIGQMVAAPAARFVSMKWGAGLAAFAVDAVLGVRLLEPTLLQEMPTLLREVQSHGVTAIGLLDAQLLLVLQGAHAVPESVWAALAQQEPLV